MSLVWKFIPHFSHSLMTGEHFSFLISHLQGYFISPLGHLVLEHKRL